MALVVVTATILAGQSLSAAVDLGVSDLLRFYMPDAWTPANLTFQLSPDNVVFSDLRHLEGGSEFMIGVMAKACHVVGTQWRAMAWLKLRSGTSARPVVQSADRQFKLVVLR